MKRIKTLTKVLISLSIIVCVALIIILSYSVDAVSNRSSSLGIYHKVRKGETVWDLARHYRTSVTTILRANKINNPRKEVRAGMKLFIPGIRRVDTQNGIWHGVRSGDTIWDIARRYGISSRDILRANNLSVTTTIFPGQRLFLPGAKELDEMFYRPLKVRLVVTSRYGYRRHPISRRRRFHHGVDLRARIGTRVYAAESGKVIFVGWYGGYGKMVILKHKGGYTTRYAHLSRIKVPNGRKVKRGDVIGLSGNTGYSTGPHLHFEIRYNGRSVNPMKYVKAS